MRHPIARVVLLALLSLSILLASTAQAATVDLPRFPSISPDASTIVFSWRGDLWKVSASGGHAERLTSHPAQDLRSQWTDDGKELVALGSEQITNVRTVLLDSEPVVAWARSVAFDNQPIAASRLDGAGDFVWTPAVTDLATSATGTSRLAAAVSTAGFAAYAWQDGDSGTADILAQNLKPDGTLGAVGLFSDGFESGDTSAWSATMP